MTPVERLAHLFRGLDRAHGVSKPTGRTSGRGKFESRYETLRAPIPPDGWAKHLAGEACLVPIPITDKGTVAFGAIDVDIYPLDVADLARRVAQLELPLITCRTKSGGAHLFLFIKEPQDATEVRTKLERWAAALGHPNVEVFPKQTTLESLEDIGSGINAPYFDVDKTTRYAVAEDGTALSLEQFLDIAESRMATGDLPDVNLDLPHDLDEAPPCLRHWAANGIPEGQRNDVMFDFAVFCKRSTSGDAWHTLFEDLNNRYCDPPLPASEVAAIVKSVSRRQSYIYKAKCQGPFCNPSLCRKAEHGRGGGYDTTDVLIEAMTVVETVPRTYYVSVDGVRVRLSSDDLVLQNRFRRIAFEECGKLMKPLKSGAWEKLVNKLRAQAEIVPAPDDAGPEGQLSQHVREFCDQYRGDSAEEIRMERAWWDNSRAYFRSRHVLSYLTRHKVRGVNERDLFTLVRELGGGNVTMELGGREATVWWIPVDEGIIDKGLPVPDPGTGVDSPY